MGYFDLAATSTRSAAIIACDVALERNRADDLACTAPAFTAGAVWLAPASPAWASNQDELEFSHCPHEIVDPTLHALSELRDAGERDPASAVLAAP